MKRLSFDTGAVIFREGEASDAAYVVVSGQVMIVQGYGTNVAETIARLGKGDFFGEMGVIDDLPRSASAVAKGPVVCMAVDHDAFMEMLLKRPEESLELLKVLFERLRTANRKLALLEKKL